MGTASARVALDGKKCLTLTENTAILARHERRCRKQLEKLIEKHVPDRFALLYRG